MNTCPRHEVLPPGVYIVVEETNYKQVNDRKVLYIFGLLIRPIKKKQGR
jgi:hypothetical protein